jgi:hypothetical protein
LLDIDNTVADGAWRLPLLGDSPANATRSAWARFFDAAHADQLLPHGAELAHRLAEDHDIVWWTGRSDRIRPLTLTWLRAHDLPAGKLLMRPNDDLRPTPVWKMEQLELLSRTRKIAVIVDDDPRVTERATELGFFTISPA